ncbi:hypothetical protein Q8A73_009266 [Channa argus]|nr:hypothetical protein Q8A73_009266 [Channa argus]
MNEERTLSRLRFVRRCCQFVSWDIKSISGLCGPLALGRPADSGEGGGGGVFVCRTGDSAAVWESPSGENCFQDGRTQKEESEMSWGTELWVSENSSDGVSVRLSALWLGAVNTPSCGKPSGRNGAVLPSSSAALTPTLAALLAREAKANPRCTLTARSTQGFPVAEREGGGGGEGGGEEPGDGEEPGVRDRHPPARSPEPELRRCLGH